MKLETYSNQVLHMFYGPDENGPNENENVAFLVGDRSFRKK